MRHLTGLQKFTQFAFIVSSALLVMIATMVGVKFLLIHRSQAAGQTVTQVASSAIGGFPMPGQLAPNFTLTDQFGKSVSLASLHGHEVVVAFIDSQCTTVCPLTAEILRTAKAQLGSSAANKVALIAINANPAATSVADVKDWSIKHGMLHQWLFLTGTSQQLQAVYKSYHIYDQVLPGNQVAHDSATLILDSQGHERLYFETITSNSPSDLRNEEVGLEVGMRQWLP